MGAFGRGVVLALCASAVAAMAQAQSSETDCRRYGDSVHCTTTDHPGVDWQGYREQQARQQQQMQQNMTALGQAIAARRQRKAMEKDAAAREERSRHYGSMIADGRCVEARREALEAGDLGMASQISGLCAPQ